MASSSYGVGQYVAAESHVAVWKVPPGRRALIYCQGSHTLAAGAWITAQSDDRQRDAILAEFFPLLCGDLSQTTTQGTFGNTTVQTRVGQLKTYAQGASFPVPVASGKVHLIAGSGGFAAASLWANANPTLVSSIVGMAPLVDLEDFYTNRTDATITAVEVNKAYNAGVDDGGTAYQAAKVAHNPTKNVASLTGIPIKLWYSTDDPYIAPSTVTAYQTAVQSAGGTCTIQSMGAVGHTAPVSACNPYEIADWFLAHP